MYGLDLGEVSLTKSVKVMSEPNVLWIESGGKLFEFKMNREDQQSLYTNEAFVYPCIQLLLG